MLKLDKEQINPQGSVIVGLEFIACPRCKHNVIASVFADGPYRDTEEPHLVQCLVCGIMLVKCEIWAKC